MIEEITPKHVIKGAAILFAILILFSSFYTISAGQRGVLLTFGKPDMESVGEGLHFKWPIGQKVKKFEVKTQKIELGADASSKDLQDVQTTIALNFHLRPSAVPSLYQEIGVNYHEIVC